MTPRVPVRGLIVIAMMLAGGLSNQSHAAGPLQNLDDGWHRWQVPSVVPGKYETIYVQSKSGQITRIDMLNRWCNSRELGNAIDHGTLSADASIDWLQQYIDSRSALRSDALAAISRHAGTRALQILIDIVESSADNDLREEAVFWMAMSESDEAFNYIDRLLMAE